ncbi:MAG: hypothetical protein M1830_009423 [Pleopsidium flavum]|nr:MAG: hypothetical protein M1830_009437 [Pleopsidium flavum]KAI9874673.1 MAG: hypothetical protein M1830_009423 [Pleopsidium flavum]
MAGTRSSARRAAAATSSPASSQAKDTSTKAAVGSKRKSDTGGSPKSKRGKKGNGKAQKTIEETMPDEGDEGIEKDVEMKEEIGAETHNGEEAAATDEGVKEDADKGMKGREDASSEKEEQTVNVEGNDGADNSSKLETTQNIEPETTSKKNEAGNTEGANKVETANTSGDAVEESLQRDDSTPSSILEKGIIYFFFRGRVNIDEPSDVNEIARSYIVLRPLPHGAKLADGAIGDDGNNRLLALPKKVLPMSHHDRFMIFVEKVKCSMEDIKNSLQSSDYATKTAGTRHTPAATPVAEGVYAITTTGRESHLAYILTIPSELSEVQKDVGLRERGSFVTTVKNPQYEGPANTNLPKGPEYPQEILEEFRSLRWMPMQPKLLDYENTQFLVIGEGIGELGKATEQQAEDEKHDKDTPLEEMEKLEHEDELRVKHLKGNDSVFEGLGLSSKDYPKVPTTW